MRLLKLCAYGVGLSVVSVALLGLLSVRGFPARAGDEQEAAGNGDVNCDGRLDLTDAVSILEYLFRGGEAPCSIAVAQEEPDLDAVLQAIGDLEAAMAECCERRWPPRAKDVINRRGTIEDSEGEPSREEILLIVPGGHSFVLTDLIADPHEIELIERTAEGDIPRGVTVALNRNYSSPLGLWFGAGSRVVLRAQRPFESGYQVIGYLARD